MRPTHTMVFEAGLLHRDRVVDIAQIDQHAPAHRLRQSRRRQGTEFIPFGDQHEGIRAGGGVPYAIPAGASDHRLGGLGFANWAYEVQQQEEELGVFFDTIVVCSVTGSTQAGMIAGFAGQDRPRRVLGIDASAKIDETRAQVAKIARNTADLIGLGRELRDDEITVLEGWAGDYYGIPVESTLDAIRLTGRLEGVIIDPVYEGKSMAALIDLVRTHRIEPESNVLYAHLGGQPALNAYSALFKN